MKNVFTFGTVHVRVQKIGQQGDQEWVAAYYENNRHQESKTYYSGGAGPEYKQDAIDTAKATIEGLK